MCLNSLWNIRTKVKIKFYLNQAGLWSSLLFTHEKKKKGKFFFFYYLINNLKYL